MVFVVILRHHKVPTLLFSCFDSFNFSLIIIQKQKNMQITSKKSQKKYFHNKPWS